MNKSVITKEFKRIERHLFDKSNWQNMKLTRTWANSQPDDAGVYMLFEKGKPVYVGESGKISVRIYDMLDSRHHTVRRAIGELRFSNHEGHQKATSKHKHPEHIETLVQKTMSKLKLCVLPISIGRKEFEEYIYPIYEPDFNRKSKRGA